MRKGNSTTRSCHLLISLPLCTASRHLTLQWPPSGPLQTHRRSQNGAAALAAIWLNTSPDTIPTYPYNAISYFGTEKNLGLVQLINAEKHQRLPETITLPVKLSAGRGQLNQQAEPALYDSFVGQKVEPHQPTRSGRPCLLMTMDVPRCSSWLGDANSSKKIGTDMEGGEGPAMAPVMNMELVHSCSTCVDQKPPHLTMPSSPQHLYATCKCQSIKRESP